MPVWPVILASVFLFLSGAPPTSTPGKTLEGNYRTSYNFLGDCLRKSGVAFYLLVKKSN